MSPADRDEDRTLNCQDCRSQLHPFLDEEIGHDETLSISRHLEACAPCRDLFDGERRCWDHFQVLLRVERTPPSLLGAIDDGIRAEERRRFWRRTLRLATPLAAAAAIIIALLVRGFGDDDAAASPGAGHAHDHGPGIRFAAMDHQQRMVDGRITDVNTLLKAGASVERLTGARFREFYGQFFGPTAKLPAEFRDAVAATIPEHVTFNGTPVSNLILDVTDVEVSIYRLSREQAHLADLHLVEGEGIPTAIRIERCRACKVVAVTRGDDVFILVTESADVDPLIALARQTF